MKPLNLINYFNVTFLYKSIEDIEDNDLFTLYDYDRFPRKMIKKENIEFDFSTIKDKCILTNKQTIDINENISKIAFSGCSLMFSNQDKVKIIYEDKSYEYKYIKFADYRWSMQRSIHWMFKNQKKEYKDYLNVLMEDYNYELDVLNFIYYYVIEVNPTKKIQSITLPNNELILIFTITLL